jgi:hypothetical protein
MRSGIKLGYIVGGFAFFLMSKPIELQGDVAPLGSGERLGYHLLALVFVVLSLASFVRGVIVAFRGGNASAARTPSRYVDVFADAPDTDAGFDPDATLARYMKNKAAEAPLASPPVPPRPAASGFGRKPV